MQTTLLRGKLWFLIVGAMLLLPSEGFAQPSETLGDYELEFVDSDFDGTNTTFTYRVSEASGIGVKDLSHWVLELCVDASLVVSWSPVATDPGIEKVEIGTDPHTGFFGIKWELEEDFDLDGGDDEDSREFSVTLEGSYSVASVNVGTFSANVSLDGSINGPDCRVCTPDDKPSWDGNFTGGVPVAGEGYFQIKTEQGFQRIELTVHNNIALTGLALADGTVVGEINLTEPLGTGWRIMEYTGSDVLTEVRILVRALSQGGSQFMFQVDDACGHGAQLDPVVQLNAPSVIALEQNYPNPFNPQTSIRFQLPEASSVKLVIYDALGRQVKSLLSGELGAGNHEAVWDGTDGSGLRVPSGVYLYRLEAGDFVQIRQMTMLK